MSQHSAFHLGAEALGVFPGFLLFDVFRPSSYRR